MPATDNGNLVFPSLSSKFSWLTPATTIVFPNFSPLPFLSFRVLSRSLGFAPLWAIISALWAIISVFVYKSQIIELPSTSVFSAWLVVDKVSSLVRSERSMASSLLRSSRSYFEHWRSSSLAILNFNWWFSSWRSSSFWRLTAVLSTFTDSWLKTKMRVVVVVGFLWTNLGDSSLAIWEVGGCGELAFGAGKLWRWHLRLPRRLLHPLTTGLIHHSAPLAAVVFLSQSRAPSQYKDRLIYVWRFPC